MSICEKIEKWCAQNQLKEKKKRNNCESNFLYGFIRLGTSTAFSPRGNVPKLKRCLEAYIEKKRHGICTIGSKNILWIVSKFLIRGWM